jgi:hypothetical protein
MNTPLNEHLPKHRNVLPVLIVFGAIVGIAIIVFGIWFFGHPRGNSNDTDTLKLTYTNPTPTRNESSASVAPAVSWAFDGNAWKYIGDGAAPACADPLNLQSPIDLTKVNSVLYPGQTRNLYKTHGGFIVESNSLTVHAPMDAVVTRGSRYIEQGEVQYLFEFLNSCGILYRFDHLLTLSPTFQKLADSLPKAEVDNSQTTNFDGSTKVVAGDIIATAVGHKVSSNASFDFGVYDLRNQNEASKSTAYQTAHANEKELAFYGSCWLDLLSDKDATTAKAFPGGDQKAGKTSDYCK